MGKYMQFDDDLINEAIQRRIEHEHDTTTQALRSELRRMREFATRALVAFDANERIDPHLITNLEQLTGHIAKWNLLRDLRDMLAQKGKEPTDEGAHDHDARPRGAKRGCRHDAPEGSPRKR